MPILPILVQNYKVTTTSIPQRHYQLQLKLQHQLQLQLQLKMPILPILDKNDEITTPIMTIWVTYVQKT